MIEGQVHIQASRQNIKLTFCFWPLWKHQAYYNWLRGSLCFQKQIIYSYKIHKKKAKIFNTISLLHKTKFFCFFNTFDNKDLLEICAAFFMALFNWTHCILSIDVKKFCSRYNFSAPLEGNNFYLLPGGIHCFYLEPCDLESINNMQVQAI